MGRAPPWRLPPSPPGDLAIHAFFTRLNRRLASPLDLGPRLLLVLAALLLAAIYFSPLWNLTMFAPQYPEGLRLDIYSYKLAGGNGGQDVKEINVLNHYIGMRDLVEEDFTEFKWLPFVVGVIGLLYLRAAVLGTRGGLIDVLVLNLYLLGVRPTYSANSIPWRSP